MVVPYYYTHTIELGLPKIWVPPRMTSLYDLGQIILCTADSSAIVSQFIKTLTTSYCIDIDTFKTVLLLLNNSDYDLLVRERCRNGICGYPLCNVNIPAPNRLIPFTWYCNDYHFDCSQFVLTQLRKFPIYDVSLLQKDLTDGGLANTASITLFEEYLRDKVWDNDMDSVTTSMNMFRMR